MSDQASSHEEPTPREPSRKEGMEFADASMWLSRIFTAIVPGMIGLWVDDRFGTKYFAIIGLVLGLTSGILNFVQATKGTFSKPGRTTTGSKAADSGEVSRRPPEGAGSPDERTTP